MINQLIDIYFYLENSFFDDLKEGIFSNNNLLEEFNYNELENIKKTIFEIDEKIDLKTALKRYILRFLIDNNYLNINSKNNLALELGKYELWILSKRKFEEIEKILNNDLKQLKINVNQIYSLYDLFEKEKDKFN